MDPYTTSSKCSEKPVGSSGLINDKRLKLGVLPFTENNKHKLPVKTDKGHQSFSPQPTPLVSTAGKETLLWRAADEAEAAH